MPALVAPTMSRSATLPPRYRLSQVSIWLFSLSTSRSAGAWVRSITAYLHDLHFQWTGAVPARPGLLPAQCARVRSALPAAGTGGACDPCTRHRAAHANRWDRGIERRTCRGIDRRYGPLGRSGWKGQCFQAPSPAGKLPMCLTATETPIFVRQVARIQMVTTPGVRGVGMDIQDWDSYFGVHLPRRPLDASRALPPTQGRSLLPPPIRPVPLCSATVQGIPLDQTMVSGSAEVGLFSAVIESS
jgi:hypothetical protein